MRTLDEAWEWYNNVKQTLKRMDRIGSRYWEVIPWDQAPWRNDKQFVTLEKEEITGPAKNGLQNLDDLAIVVLFSVFEALVRGIILDQIKGEESRVRHRVITKAIESAKDRIGEGSFFAVLESYKGTQNNLIEEVNQVRKYRNWVAHGKRGPQPPFVAPDVAYRRLTSFLTYFFPVPVLTDEWIGEWLEQIRGNAD
jgi:hypothetical protein